MRKTIILLLLLAAIPCVAVCYTQGSLHLVPPSTTVFCRQNGVMIWAATYAQATNQFVVEDVKVGQIWYLPYRTEVSFADYGTQTTKRKRSRVAAFTFEVGKVANDWVPVILTGN